MSSRQIKILFLSDTHLGFDLSFNPRIKRRRRGDDFYNNFKRALSVIKEKKIDIVLHGGDLFYRSKIPDQLIDYVFEPIMEVVNAGTPLVIVPGNHERSFIPRTLFHTHPNLMIFDEAKTFNFHIGSFSLSMAGFPFHRNNIRDNFLTLVDKTKYQERKSDFNLLCIHHAIQGSTVGIQNYTFREGEDVIRTADLPKSFDLILSGHIHRAQVIQKDLNSNPIKVPIIYPGSIERTSFVERNEDKGYYILELDKVNGQKKITWEFVALPARPMLIFEFEHNGMSTDMLKNKIAKATKNIDVNSIVQIKLVDTTSNTIPKGITAEFLRSIVPETVNISLTFPGYQQNEFSS